jgi:hypothetical protein
MQAVNISEKNNRQAENKWLELYKYTHHSNTGAVPSVKL